jgi:hypothetical protein
MNMNSFLRSENEVRVSKYAKCCNDEEFLVRLNSELACLDESLYSEVSPDIPNIYIFGLPRSGTTLLYQLITHTFDVAWPTNLMARFWMAPVVGMRLSKILGLFEERVDFNSSYGVTKGANGPHEFGYFWMKALGYSDMYIGRKPEDHRIDWRHLGRTISAISNEAGRSVVYKNLLPACHLNRFREIQESGLFIFVTRNIADIAVSLLTAREKRYGVQTICWSFRPWNYDKIAAGLKGHEQVLCQLKGLVNILETQFDAIKKTNILIVKYESLCRNPIGIIQQIKSWFSEQGVILGQSQSVTSFNVKTHRNHPLYGYYSGSLKDENNLFDFRH